MRNLILCFILIISCITGFTSSYAEESIINDEDIKTIQNDSIVPRKTLLQSNEAIKNVNGERQILESLITFNNSNRNITDPIIATRNLSFLLLTLFVIYQIVLTVIGKTTLKELTMAFLAAVVMHFGVAIGVYSIVSLTDVIGIFFNSIVGKDFVAFSLENMMSFVAIPGQANTNISIESIGKLNSVDFDRVNLSMEGFCLTTIQDQYRVITLILNWVYVILVFANWLILIGAELVITVCIYLFPFIGASYIFGDRLEIIRRYWTILFQAAITKAIFFMVLFVIVGVSNSLKPTLVNSGVNIEFALFSCALLVALGFAVLNIRKFAQVDSGINNVVNAINKLNKQK